MRHFLRLTTAITGLAVRVIAPSKRRALMAGPGSALAFQSRPLGAAAVAVDLIALAATADQRQLPAACTAVAAQRSALLGPTLFCTRRDGPLPRTVAGCRSESHGLWMGTSQRLGQVARRARVAAFPSVAVTQDAGPGSERRWRPQRSAHRRAATDGMDFLSSSPIHAGWKCRHFVRHPQRHSTRICSAGQRFWGGADIAALASDGSG